MLVLQLQALTVVLDVRVQNLTVVLDVRIANPDCSHGYRASNRYILAVFWYGDFENVWKYGLLKKNTAANLPKITAVKSSVDFENPLKFVIAAAVLPVSAHRP